MSIKHELRRLLWKMGYDFSRFIPESNPFARRKKLINAYAIDVVLDVGANSGQYSKQLRNDLGFSGRIISFEPLSSAFEKLKNNARGDPKWQVINCALGDTEIKKEINVAKNSYSSSLLKMLPRHIESAPESQYIYRELIDIKTLDSLIDGLYLENENIYLKIDTQGFESKVIKGAEKSLAQICTVQLEMSLVPLYEEELLFDEMYNVLVQKGYTLVAIEPGFSDFETGQVLQVDGIFHRQ